MSGWPDPNAHYGPVVYPQTYVYLPQQHRSSTAHLVFAWLAAALSAGYMLPWAIGATRNRTNCAATALVNFFFGWTLVGWMIALVMACGSEPAQPVVVRTIPGQPYRPTPNVALAPAPMPVYRSYPGYPALPGGQPSTAEVTMPLPAYGDPRRRDLR
jgi:hypothetical protein